MGFMDGVIDLFPHEITLAPWTGQNEAGEGTYGTGEIYRAKIERGTDLKRTGVDGRSIVPLYKIFIGEPVQVDPRDQLTLDSTFGKRDENGDFVAATPPIVQVLPIYDEQEWVCTVIYCG
jgi:hypothetical protein